MMTYIGYILSYNNSNRWGLLLDSNKKLRIFTSDNDTIFNTYQFVTFSGDGLIVGSLTALTDYFKKTDSQMGIKYGIDEYYLTDTYGFPCGDSNNAECFIVNRLCNNQDLFPSYSDPLYSDMYNRYLMEIKDRVDYVSNNIKEIANSYQVYIYTVQISKVGGDDRFYTKRCTKISYRDDYIDRFILSDKTLNYQSGYTSNFESPYKEGRCFKEEEEGRCSLLDNYDKQDHLTTLLYEYFRESQKKMHKIEKDNSLFALYWQMTPDMEGIKYDKKLDYILRQCRNLKADTYDLRKKDINIIGDFLDKIKEYNNFKEPLSLAFNWEEFEKFKKKENG